MLNSVIGQLSRTGFCRRNPARPAAVLPLIAVLQQLDDLLAALTDEQYRTNPVGVVGSSIGGHVRHCLDHVAALLAGYECGAIDYDQRERGTDVETNRATARATVQRQQAELLEIPPTCEDWPLRLTALVHPGLPVVAMDTSVARELAFVLSHTIHHNSLIGVMAKTLGVPVPDRFGYAPATLAYQEKAR